MDADGLPIIGIGVNLTKVEAIPAKRTLAFLNHFITHTVAFLNRFSSVCDEKLEDLSVRMQRLETSMCILEAKLASIPGLENVTVATSSTTLQQPTAAATIETPIATDQQNGHLPCAADTNTAIVSNGHESSRSDEEPTQPVAEVKVAEDPRYAKYRQMMRVGVPLQAFRQKMIVEGLDPAVLEGPPPTAADIPPTSETAEPPSVMIPPAISAPPSASNQNDSDSDFSDDDRHSSQSSSDASSDFDD